MTAKEYLSEISKMKKHLILKAERLAELKDQAAGIKAITYDKDRVQVTPENRMEDMLVKIADLETKYAHSIALYHAEVQKREREIYGMERPDHEEVLRLRYLETGNDGEKMRLEEIALRMHRSYNRVKHLHGEALEAFRRKYLVSKY